MSKNSKNKSPEREAMRAVLAHFGISNYDNGVLNQMVEFTRRSINSLLEDATLYSRLANKELVDLEDVELAISQQSDKTSSPSSGEGAAKPAGTRNCAPNQRIRLREGLNLSPDQHTQVQHNPGSSGLNVSEIPSPTFNIQTSPGPNPAPNFSGDNEVSSAAIVSVMPSGAIAAPPTTLSMPAVGCQNTDVKPTVRGIKRSLEDDDYDN